MKQSEIAATLGVSRQTLANWKKEGLEITEANLPQLRAKAEASKTRQELSKEIQEARLRKLRAEAETKEHALAVEQGRYVLASDSLAAGQAAGVASRAAWEKIASDLPPLLEGLSAAQMVPKLRDYGRLQCLELSEHFKE